MPRTFDDRATGPNADTIQHIEELARYAFAENMPVVESVLTLMLATLYHQDPRHVAGAMIATIRGETAGPAPDQIAG
ncbi:hypothetical protein [Muricoccus radiodurans]|uniref:hypothetical protein n=1 Tax=Muricoccus radiodurans TaxID=2231721 RepID=UPI003CF9923C